jgi:hypothetical protein
MTGFTDPFMVPYVLALGGRAFHAGLLSSVRNLVLSLSQICAVEAVHAVGSRRRIVLWAVGIQAVLWIPIALAAPAFGSSAILVVITLFTIGSTAAALGGPVNFVYDASNPDVRTRDLPYFNVINGCCVSLGAERRLAPESTAGDRWEKRVRHAVCRFGELPLPCNGAV